MTRDERDREVALRTLQYVKDGLAKLKCHTRADAGPMEARFRALVEADLLTLMIGECIEKGDLSVAPPTARKLEPVE